MRTIEIEAGSYRDPAGKIIYNQNRVFRILNNEGVDRLRFLQKKNLLLMFLK